MALLVLELVDGVEDRLYFGFERFELGVVVFDLF